MNADGVDVKTGEASLLEPTEPEVPREMLERAGRRATRKMARLYKVLGVVLLGLAGLILAATGHAASSEGKVVVTWWSNPDWRGTPSVRMLAGFSVFSQARLPPHAGLMRGDQWSGRVDALLKIPADGTWTLHFTVDDGGTLWLGQDKVIEEPGPHPPVTRTVTRQLKAGWLPIRIMHNQLGGTASLNLQWSVGQGRPEPIPAVMFAPPPEYQRSWPPWVLGLGLLLLGVALGVWLVPAAIRTVPGRWKRVRGRGRSVIKRLRVDRQWMFFNVLLVLHLLPLAIISYFPSQDGPAHVMGGLNLVRAMTSDGWLVRKWLDWAPALEPNVLGHLLLGLMQYVVPAGVAERVLVAGYMAGTALGFRALLVAMDSRLAWGAVLVFPFLINWPLQMGFYNFCLALPFMFWLVAVWLRHHRRLREPQWVGLCLLGLLMGFSHPVPAALGIMAVGVLAVWMGLIDMATDLRWQGAVSRNTWNLCRRRLVTTVLAMAPAGMVLLIFQLAQTDAPGAQPQWDGLWQELKTGNVLVSFRGNEALPTELVVKSLAVMLVLSVVVKMWRRHVWRWDVLLVFACVVVGMLCTLPDAMSGGSFLTPRLFLLSFMCTALWLAVVPWPRWLQFGIQGWFTVLALWMLWLHAEGYVRVQPVLREFASVSSHIHKDSSVLVLSWNHTGVGEARSERMRALVHAGGYVGAESWSVNLSTYEHNMPHFQLRWRPEVNPYTRIGIDYRLEDIPPCVEFTRFEQTTGERVDYVMTWMLDEKTDTRPCTRDVAAQLKDRYELVYQSKPDGRARLYRKRGLVDIRALVAAARE